MMVMIFSLLQSPILLLYFIIALLIALTFHEFAHAWVSSKLGDETAEMLGRVTLNPLAHLDFLGTVFLLLVGFGWGKPVPFNPANFKNPKRDSFLTAIAGPITNLLLAILFAIPFRIGQLFGMDFSTTIFGSLFMIIIEINIILGVFNLIPIPPLDGSKILYLFAPRNVIIFLERYGIMILFGLIILSYLGSFDIFSSVIVRVTSFLEHLFVFYPN
jgi:Zn-dependent protease